MSLAPGSEVYHAAGGAAKFKQKTTAVEVIERFAGRSKAAADRLKTWRGDPNKADVVPVVQAHTVAAVYRLTPSDVERVCKGTEHALGEVKKSIAEQVVDIRDWHPAFAFTHVFHFATEALGALPTYQDFRSFCKDDKHGREMLWRPAQEAVSRAELKWGRDASLAAMRWRVGNAYYSFLREMYVLAVLRDWGTDAHVHPLADALFRADLWVGNTNVSLFIGNGRFRDGSSGRKEKPEHLFSDAQPPFGFQAIELKTQHEFGAVHLPSLADIKHAAKKLTPGC